MKPFVSFRALNLLAPLIVATCLNGALAPAATAAVALTPVLTGLSKPLYVTSAHDSTNRLFIVEQGGVIKVLPSGGTTPTVYVDIVSKVLSTGSEQGLLGLAFHPQFATNSRFFVNYTRKPDGATVVAEYHAFADPVATAASETVLLVVAQPFANHNAGMIEFGPDGFLYIGMGDGGSSNDPGNRAQNKDDLLGKLLRIDVDHPAGGNNYSSPASNPFFGATPGRDEIYALGLRNPFRFSFDRQTGQLYLGDVGQNAIEEVDILTVGGNYGWRVYEGTQCTNNDPTLCTPSNYAAPIAQYAHTGGRCSITGGYVYRGPAGTFPAGTYVFADYCTGEIFTMPAGGSAALLLDTSLNISSFGEDEAGEMYVVGLGGTVHRLTNTVANTTTTLVSSVNPSLAGATVTFTATVTGTNPSGSVSFADNGNPIGGCTALPFTGGSGNQKTAACSTSLAAGTHPIVATYLGDAANAGSTSSTLSQVVDAAPQGSINVALATNGGIATSSSSFSSGTAPPGAINGDRRGLNWNNGGGWKSGAALPQWLEVQFAGQRTLDRVVLYDVQDDYTSPIEPTDTMINALYGSSFIDFTVSVWNGASFVVAASVTNNNLVKRTVTFPAVTTDRIRVTVTRSADPYARLTELEAFTVSQGGPAATTTSLASSANPSLAGAMVVFTATVSGTNPTGSVSFADNGNPIGGCTALPFTGGSGNQRTVACSTSFAAGTHPIVATYSGDATNAPSTSSTLSQAVSAPATSSTTLVSSVNPSLAGATVTFTATVTGTNPSGSVSFADNGNPIGGCTALPFTGGSGNQKTAACSTSLAAGTHPIVATYLGDAANAGSTSSTLSQVVDAAPQGSINVALATNGGIATSSSSFSSGTAPPGAINGDRRGLNWNNGGGWKSGAALPQWLEVQFAGQRTLDRVVLYDVQDDYTSPIEPTDTMINALYGSSFIDFTVSVWNGASFVVAASVTNNNLVKRTVTFPAVTTDRIRVTVTRSADPYARLTELEAFTVSQGGPAATTTSLASSANPSLAGAMVVFTATVSGTNPTGSVSFADNGNPIGGCTALPFTGGSGNQRTVACSTSFAAGTHPIVATYSGDATNAPSTSSTLSQAVSAPATSSTTLVSSVNPSLAGATVTFTATVTGTNPSGSVSFADNGNPIGGCTALPFTGGSGNQKTAACSTSLAAGTHPIVATYLGDAANAGSTSSTLSQVVDAAPQGSINVALATNGGIATSSSSFSSGTAPPGAINGDRRGLNWNNGGGWKSGAALPQWLEVQFAGQRTLDRVVLYDVQDDYTSPIEPTDTMINALYGSSFIDFTVSVWNGASFVVAASVTNNNLVKRTVTFPAVTTDRIRVTVTRSADPYARLTELEAWGTTGSGTPSTAAWSTFGRDAQHTALSATASQPLNQIRWQMPVDLQPQYSGNGSLLVHYGSPLMTTANTIIVPVKTGATGGFRVEARAGSTGALQWSMDSDYILPAHNWVPAFGPALSSQSRVYFPGAGGRVLFRDEADATAGASGQVVFYGLANYQANPTAYDATVIINTPLTIDPSGNLYFGFVVTGSTPLGLTSGIARIGANGQGTWTPVTTASADAGMTKVPHNSAPALSADHQTLYVAVSNGSSGYLVALDSTTLAPLARAALIDPVSGQPGTLSDNGSASPTVGTDGDVYFGVLENPFGSNHRRGWLLHFNGSLSQAKTPGAFGWDTTVGLVPASMVPSYQGPSTYLLSTKYNHYLGLGGDGQNKIAILDPNATQIDPVTQATVMKEILTMLGPTPESGGGVKEWCINTAAVDPATKSVLANNEDGKLYRWDLTTNTLSQVVVLTAGLGEAYTSTVIGPDGKVYATNNATLFAVGQ